jgi:hypothetical protein
LISYTAKFVKKQDLTKGNTLNPQGIIPNVEGIFPIENFEERIIMTIFASL